MAVATYGQEAKFKTSEDKEAFEHIDATKPYEFQSTSTMSGSGSTLPIAARNGMSAENDNQTPNPKQPRKAPPITGGDDMPVGDGVWVMMMLALGYAGWMMRRVRACRSRGESRTCTM